MSELGKTGDRLSDAIDTTTETLSETLKGVEGGEAIDAVSKIVSQTAAIVREDLSAAENIADAVGQKVVVEADAVLSIMEDKAYDSVEAVRAAKTTVQESTSSDTSESLQAALTRNVEEIRADQDTTERLAEAIQTDALNDQEAFEVLESSSKEVISLINAVDGAVGKAADSVSGNNDSDGGGGDDVIADAVEKVEEQMDEVEKSMSNVMDAAEKCQDCKVKEMVEEMDDENVSDSAKGEVDTKSEEVEEDSSHDEKESKVEEVDAVSETKDEDVADSPADEKEHDLEVSSSTVEEAKFIENESIGKEEETLSHSESHHAEDEGVHGEPHELITSQSSGHAEDVGDFKHDEIGEVAQNIAEPTLFSSGGHDDGEGVRDVIESVHHHHQSDALVDSLSSVESSHSIEHVVANAARIATEVDHTTYSDTAHEFSTWSTEAVAVVIAAVSSLYMA